MRRVKCFGVDCHLYNKDRHSKKCSYAHSLKEKQLKQIQYIIDMTMVFLKKEHGVFISDKKVTQLIKRNDKTWAALGEITKTLQPTHRMIKC